MELTKNNYLYGTGSGDTWNVFISPATRPVKSYFEETLEVAKFVYENKDGKLYLLFSGGLDSQYVFNIFELLKFEFVPVIIRLLSKDGFLYNHHDIRYAFEFCEKKGVSPLLYDLDFDNFVEKGLIVDIAESVHCGSPALPATMYVASKLDGFTVFGNDPPYLRLNKETNTWQLEELEIIHSILRFYLKHNLSGCPYFLSYTPEMMVSFLQDQAIKDLANHKFPGKLGTNSTKSLVFNNGSGFNMPSYDFEKGDFVKLTGYEIVYQSPIMQHPNMKKFIEFRKNWSGEYLEDYNLALDRLTFKE